MMRNEIERLAVFDFDGTIIPFNSFRLYIAYLPLLFLVSGDFSGFAAVVSLVCRKANKRISHLQFKRALVDLSAGVKNFGFAKFLFCICRSNIKKEISLYKSIGCTTCLSTAAPSNYANKVAEFLGVDQVFAYGDGRFSWEEGVDNIGSTKLRNIDSHFGSGCYVIEVMYTDHSDDIPLLETAIRKVVVKPRKEQYLKIVTLFPEAEFY